MVPEEEVSDVVGTGTGSSEETEWLWGAHWATAEVVQLRRSPRKTLGRGNIHRGEY